MAIRTMSIMTCEHEWAKAAREAICRESVLDRDELSLFEWHVGETQRLIDEMTADEKEQTQKELDAEDECAGSGWIAVDYFVKRIRYGQVIYLVSLIETFFTRACERLIVAVGENNILFGLDELSGGKLPKRRKFLKRYGRITVPDNQWEPIERMVFIRNICVHENGCVNSRETERSDWPPGVTADQGDLVLGASYISDCLTAVRALTEHVEKELRQVANRSFRAQPVQKNSSEVVK